MQVFRTVQPKLTLILGSVLVLVLLLGVACGSSAAPAAPQPQPDAAPSSGSADTTAPSDSASSSGAVPTTVPKPASSEAMAESMADPDVHPGKVTWMVGSFANERMTYCLAGGGGHDYGRQIHGFLIESAVKDGARELVPGIAEKWEVTPDGRSWTVTIREGVKFNDGSDLTVEDVLWTFRWAIGPQAADYATGGGCLSQSQLSESIEQGGVFRRSICEQCQFSGGSELHRRKSSLQH